MWDYINTFASSNMPGGLPEGCVGLTRYKSPEISTKNNNNHTFLFHTNGNKQNLVDKSCSQTDGNKDIVTTSVSYRV